MAIRTIPLAVSEGEDSSVKLPFLPSVCPVSGYGLGGPAVNIQDSAFHVSWIQSSVYSVEHGTSNEALL